MDTKAGLYLTAITALVAGSTWVSSDKDYVQRVTAASAEAIRAYDEILFDPEVAEAVRQEGTGKISLCIESSVALDYDLMRKLYSDTVAHPVPIESCTSIKVDGEGGMFLYFIHWFDSKGERAADLSIRRAQCPTRDLCEVDIDGNVSGYRFKVEQVEGEWIVTDRDMGWVV